MLASPAPEGWPLPISRFEAESGSLSLRLAPYALQGSDHSITQLSPPARLHVLQAFHMVSSFQPTREARFILTHRSTRGRHSRHDINFITGTIVDSAMGLLFNFNEVLLKNGLRRVVNRLPEPSPRAPLPRILRVK